MSENLKYEVVQAYDGAVIAELTQSCETEAMKMLSDASDLHHQQPEGLPAWRRIEILRRLTELMTEETEELAILIAREGGKPLTDARVEVVRAINGIDLAIAELLSDRGIEVPMDLSKASAGKMAFTSKVPIGVVVAVSAFNHPLNLIVHQVIPAVAVGCPVIVKPAQPTPLSCIRIVELLTQAGLPDGWCQTCLCTNDVAEKLITDSRVAFFSFIGSSRVGWYLRSKLAPGTRCALEHGGVAPVIISKDADIATITPKIVKGGYYHAGQVCVSVQRIFVDNQIKPAFLEELRKQVSQLVTGDPTLAETEVGPLIRPGEVDRVEAWVKEAIDEGANCLIGGERISDHVYAPTILDNPNANSKVSNQEIFGPVTCVYGYDDVKDAVDQANSLPVSFQASVFSNDINTAFGTAKKLSASAVMINDHTAFRVDWMPFAGLKTSGLGVGGIGYTMEDMTEEKMIVLSLG